MCKTKPSATTGKDKKEIADNSGNLINWSRHQDSPYLPKSNIPFRLWMERMMARRVNHQHHSKGWLFETRTGVRAKFGKFDAAFRSFVVLA